MIAMEYIIANNAMSASKPLNIVLSSINQHLDISYTYQPKAQIESSSEQQLNALKERYNNLSDEPMELLQEDGTNVIRYPLLTADER
jgi:hypothetical protein